MFTRFAADDACGAVGAVFSQVVLWHSEVRRQQGDVALIRHCEEVLGELNLRLGGAVCKNKMAYDSLNLDT